MIKKVALSARSLITLIRIVMYGLYDDSRKIMGVRVISQPAGRQHDGTENLIRYIGTVVYRRVRCAL